MGSGAVRTRVPSTRLPGTKTPPSSSTSKEHLGRSDIARCYSLGGGIDSRRPRCERRGMRIASRMGLVGAFLVLSCGAFAACATSNGDGDPLGLQDGNPGGGTKDGSILHTSTPPADDSGKDSS